MEAASKKSSIVSRLGTGPVVLLVITMISFVLTVFMGIMNQWAYQDRVDLIINSQRFVNGSGTLTDEVRAYAATGDVAHFDAYWYEIREAKNRDIGLENMRRTGITEDEEALIAEMSGISNTLVPIEEAAMEMRKNGLRDAAINLVYGEEYSRAITKIREISSSFLTAIDRRTDDSIKFANLMLQIFGGITGLLIISVIVYQIKNVRFVHKNLVDPMNKIREEMERISEGSIMRRFEMQEDDSEVGMIVHSIKQTKRNLRKYVGDIADTLQMMASGDLTKRIDTEYHGDFQPIKHSLEGILTSLNDMISRMSKSVSSTAGAVTDRASHLLEGANDLADQSSEQAQTIEHISESIRALANEMHDIADTASRSNASTSAAAAELEASNTKMHDMQSAMDEISSASEGIKKISDTIAGIGARTTIVALNAAIEAAKAGEVGRGFSVVADEVRNLAIMCGDASRDTNALVETTLKAVNRGIDLMNGMTGAMGDLLEATRASSDDIAEISEHSKAQASSLHEVSEGFDEITTAVRRNATTAESSAESARELDEQASDLLALRKLFEEFKLR